MPGRIVCSVSGSIARYDATTKKTDECVTEVSVQGHMQRQPKWNHHKLGADRDLVVSTTFKKGTLPQSVNLQTLADTGSQVFFMVGYDCVPHGAVIAAPKPIGLVGAGQALLPGGGQGFSAEVHLQVLHKGVLTSIYTPPVFVYLAGIGSRGIMGLPFLRQYALAVIPGIPYLVTTESLTMRVTELSPYPQELHPAGIGGQPHHKNIPCEDLANPASAHIHEQAHICTQVQRKWVTFADPIISRTHKLKYTKLVH